MSSPKKQSLFRENHPPKSPSSSTEPPKTTEGESPPQDTEPSEVRKHLNTFRVNDIELEAINRRYDETSFRSRGDFCRYSSLSVMNVEEDTEDISRLGRSTKDLLNIIDALTDKGVTLISHKENIDTDTPAGKFMLTVFAALSQLKREQLKQRQR